MTIDAWILEVFDTRIASSSHKTLLQERLCCILADEKWAICLKYSPGMHLTRVSVSESCDLYALYVLSLAVLDEQ